MRKQEDGQVLPLGLVLVVLCVVGALLLFNTSQVASDKMRLANSADAAAYSGALWQARALNYQAYANRAMVANQVAIGQAVSLQSWMTYASMTSQNIATALKPVPVLNLVTSGIDGAVAVAEQAVTLGARTLLAASNAATRALSLSQSAMHAATLANTEELISVVARESDPRFTTNSVYGLGRKASNATEWLAFNTQHTKRDKSAMLNRQQLIMASRDRFTRQRNWSLFNNWVPSGFNTFHKLRRQGATRLLAVKTPQGLEWEWVAKDTMSIHNKVYTWKGKKLKEVPVAWAAAFTNSRRSNRPINRQSCGRNLLSGFKKSACTNFTSNNHVAEDFADLSIPNLLGKQTRIPMQGYGGVRSFWDLSKDAQVAADARLTVRVEVSLPAAELRNSDAILNAGQLSSPLVVAGKTLSSVSAADVFYRHPRHHFLSGSQRDRANAYNPYWQAQLSPVSKVERLAALGLRSGGTKPVSHSSGESRQVSKQTNTRTSTNTQGGLGHYRHTGTFVRD
ncbi:MAG: pilus assembly protein TadG-related protein [Granulosicoccus sp.]